MCRGARRAQGVCPPPATALSHPLPKPATARATRPLAPSRYRAHESRSAPPALPPPVRPAGKTTTGQTATVNGVYVYWYVADKAISGDPTGAERMWSMAKKLLQTGELQRWAYVTFLTTCPPGQEDTAFARLREFISAAVPDFQITQPEKEVAVGGK